MHDPACPIDVMGMKMFVDSLDSLGLLAWGVYEKRETELVRRIVKRGDVVVDIGANIGYYVVLLAALVGEEGRVYAFEPEPSNYNLLVRNVAVNACQNVTAELRAVSEMSGSTKLHLAGHNCVGHAIHARARAPFMEVKTVGLDGYFQLPGAKVNFIKMDVEGAEGLALKGMQSLLKENESVKILSEFFPARLNRSEIGAGQFLEMLVAQNFTLYDLKPEPPELATIDTLMGRYRGELATNLLCTRGPFPESRPPLGSC